MLKNRLKELRRLFDGAVTVEQLAEPLASFDESASSEVCLRFMEEHNFDVVGIRADGYVSGIATRQQVSSAQSLKDSARLSADLPRVDDDEPLASAMRSLVKHEYVLVESFGHIGGIVTRSDVQKEPARLWMFALVTLLEVALTETVRQAYGESSLLVHLDGRRKRAALGLWQLRRRENRETRLVDCLQFADKWQLVLARCGPRSLGSVSRKQALKEKESIRKLRDELAHVQELTGEQLIWALRTALKAEQVLDALMNDATGASSVRVSRAGRAS